MRKNRAEEAEHSPRIGDGRKRGHVLLLWKTPFPHPHSPLIINYYMVPEPAAGSQASMVMVAFHVSSMPSQVCAPEAVSVACA